MLAHLTPSPVLDMWYTTSICAETLNWKQFTICCNWLFSTNWHRDWHHWHWTCTQKPEYNFLKMFHFSFLFLPYHANPTVFTLIFVANTKWVVANHSQVPKFQFAVCHSCCLYSIIWLVDKCVMCTYVCVSVLLLHISLQSFDCFCVQTKLLVVNHNNNNKTTNKFMKIILTHFHSMHFPILPCHTNHAECVSERIRNRNNLSKTK